jgi:hypothetical protein
MGREIKIEIAIVICVLVAFIAGGVIWFLAKQNIQMPESQLKMCTSEAKICPDGSAVVRTGANCEFSQCPTAGKISTQAENLITFKNAKYGFEFKYPERFGEVSFEVIPEAYTPDGEIIGTEMRGMFTNIPSSGIVFGGATSKYDDTSRSTSSVNFKGYIKNSDGYFFGLNSYTGEPFRKMEPKKILNNLVLFVDCKSFGGVCDIPDSSYRGIVGTKNEMAGLINLKGDKFKGLIILADKGYISEAEFEKILTSVKVF